MNQPARTRHGRQTALSLGACFLLALAALAYPLYVIRPFRPQGPQELAAALAVLRYRFPLELLLALVALFVAVRYWRREPRPLRRAAAVAGVLLTVACAALSRVNVYERMFHPNERPSFAAATQARLDAGEMVLAINVNGAARAYPVRSLSYHHIVNDTLNGVPIVATY